MAFGIDQSKREIALKVGPPTVERSRLRRGRTANKGQRRRSSHPFTTLVAPVYPLPAALPGGGPGRRGAGWRPHATLRIDSGGDRPSHANRTGFLRRESTYRPR